MQAFLLYGANGYTGRLIARFASRYGLQPVLAGRNAAAVTALAGQLQLPYRIFSLDDTAALKAALQDVPLVVHAAGPYDQTAGIMVEACLATHTHYMDLNGDHDVFDHIRTYDAAAKAANIMLLPGAGFDVVPTDCLALWLKKQLPDATALQLAFNTIGGALSRGTALTSLLKAGRPGAVRKQGRLVFEPLGKRGLAVSFPGERSFFAMSLPWGDISTAYYSTGIPDIEVYYGVKKAFWHVLKAQGLYNWLLRTKAVRSLSKAVIHRLPAGPDDAHRDKATTLIWGKVTNSTGDTVTGTLRCPDAYTLTADAVLVIARKILQQHYTAGYQTPATAYGENLVLELPGVIR